MKKRILPMLPFFFGMITATSPAWAARTTSKITCEEFLKLEEVRRPDLVYWIEGFDRKGRPEDEVLDFEQVDRLIPVLVEECVRNPKHSVASKLSMVKKK